MHRNSAKNPHETLDTRFGTAERPWADCDSLDAKAASHGSVRQFTSEAVDAKLVRSLCALALSAPSKSDLQGRDIIIVQDRQILSDLKALLTSGPLAQPWIANIQHMLVFCGNNRRQRLWHEWHGIPFVNDHLDAFFNAAVDAGIALSAFVSAAESHGLGTCPVSAIRNHASAVSNMLGLPDHVFPVAGLAFGWPSEVPKISPRLPLSVTVHTDRYSENDLRGQVEAYDVRREALQPYRQQRNVPDFGLAESYGWSLDKARQYATPERETFGRFVRAKGFDLT
ncbi:MAG: nitroreductase family protein [Beijerinckiaceae bacterium]